ncbi:MAG: PIN domain-containing protein [Geodermatophilaceae bacterium]|jgi:predicted nucleic acid-binding protein
MTSTRSFVDTNVFVYAADVVSTDVAKRDVASGLLAEEGGLVVSTQVLQEFYIVVTRKLRPAMSAEEAAESVQRMTRLEVVLLDVPLVRQAIDTSRAATISLWDALVVEAARYAKCERILTEDLSHGQTIRGIAVHNPFRSASG